METIATGLTRFADVTTALRVAILSPEPIVRAGLQTLLGRHPEQIEFVAVSGTPFDPEPEVVVFDSLFLVDDDTAQLELLIKQTAAKVLVLDRDLRPDLASRASRLGADGFFPMGVGEAELVAAVLSAGTGWTTGDPGADPTVGSSGSAARARQIGSDLGLTVREISVLTLIAQGYSNLEIAKQLFLSINSIKTYIRTAYARIGINSRSEAVRWAIQHGLDPTPGDD